MNARTSQLDLVVLVADDDQRATFQELLRRHQALQIRPIAFGVIVHDDHDPGVLHRPEALLRPYLKDTARAIAVLDRDGSGAKEAAAADIELQVEQLLERNGWAREAGALDEEWPRRRCASIVIDPELENWVWADSPHVAAVLGWPDQSAALRAFLQNQDKWAADAAKPHQPKEAMTAALREKKLPRSPSNFASLARQVTFQRCADRSFLRLRAILSAWFPPS